MLPDSLRLKAGLVCMAFLFPIFLQGAIKMASIPLEPAGGYADLSGIARRPLFPAVRWGAVFAGVAVGVSVQLALTLLGIASGLSAIDVEQGEGVGIGPLIWAGLSMLVAAFVGAYVAARMTGLKRKVDGVLHGVVSWAVATLLFATLATSAGGSMLSGVFSAMKIVSGAAANSTASSDGGGVAAMLKSQIGGTVSPAALQTLQQHIQAGRRDEAIQYMTNTMGVEPVRAGTIADQALILTGLPERASPQARASADRALGIASTAAWTVFLAVALSLAFGIAGGALGAVGARRETWADSDEARGGRG
jgi:hypothetical protein